MTKPKKNPSQTELLEAVGHLKMDAALSAAFADDLKHHRKSRQTVANELSDLLGRRITLRNLDNWAASSHRGHRVPLDVAAAIHLVTGNMNALSVAAAAAKAQVISGKDKDYLILKKKEISRQRLDREIQDLKDRLL